MVRTPATRFATLFVIGDDQSVMVKHSTLKARIRTHIFANLLAHKACIAISGKCIKEHPEQLPATHGGVEKLHAEFAYGREVTDEGKARPN